MKQIKNPNDMEEFLRDNGLITSRSRGLRSATPSASFKPLGRFPRLKLWWTENGFVLSCLLLTITVAASVLFFTAWMMQP